PLDNGYCALNGTVWLLSGGSTNTTPLITTGVASSIGMTNATLNGAVNPNGQSTTVQFEFGPTASYGSVAPVSGTFSEATNQAISAVITGLTPGAIYHFRATATNASGSTTGSDATFTTATTPVVDLAITATRNSNFTQGDAADTYTITITNVGTASSSGTVTVLDTLPSGLTATAISGTGWTTDLATLTCTRSDTLAIGAAYPPITLTVSVASNAPASLTNVVTVSGGGDATSANNTANDVTSINATGGSGATTYTGVLAGWDVSGQTNFGVSPLAPTTNAASLTIVGLARGSGVGISGSASTKSWGGNTWNSTSEAAAISANEFATASITAQTGYKVSISSISQFDYRRSSSGPPNGELQYQIGSGAFTDIAAVSYTSTTGASLSPIDLSGISALQNVGAGTTVTFRIVNWGGTSSGGTWYILDLGASSAPDFAIQGTVASIVTLTPIETWRLQWFGSTNNTGNAADTFVNSSDGMPNLLKYALGLNPLTPTNSPISGDISTGYLRLTAPKNTNATDVTFAVEVTGNVPGGWTINGTTTDQNTSALFQAHDNTAVPSSTSRFIRLRVSRP
ncbi:MAG: beta strand repeat-containing protein, partial [Limisphaerales bacterium]